MEYWKAMFKMTKGHRGKYFGSFALTFASVFLMLSSRIVTKVLIDVLSDPATLADMDIALINTFGGREFLISNLYIFSLIIFFLAVVRSLVLISRNIMRAAVETTIMKETQLKLFDHIIRLPYMKVKAIPSGELLQTATRDEEVLRNFLIRQVNMLVYTFFVVTLSFGMLVALSWKIALATIVLLPVLGVYSFFLIKKVRVLYRKTDDSEARMTSKIEENLSAVRLVKAYNNEVYEIKNFETYIDDYEDHFIRWRKLASFYFSSTDIFVFGQIAISLIAGIILAFQGEISVGTLYLATSLANMIVWPVRQVANILSNLAQALASIDRINLIFNEPIEDIETGLTPEIHGHIVFDNVSFQYEDGDVEVLKNINLEVLPGETIAIIGKTGSGKSTFVNMLTRLYDYDEGHIYLDGVELKEIQKAHLRQNVASVLQEPFLFSKTIISNLRMANKNATDEEVLRATKTADIHNTIVSFNKGYDTPVGEQGVTLSGGQKQRLTIARTLINNAPILIFDDSLSAVDTETDINIRSALKVRQAETTTFIVTHRIATAKDADRIIVFEDGVIKQNGTHEQLITEEGLYKRVFEIQTRIE